MDASFLIVVLYLYIIHGIAAQQLGLPLGAYCDNRWICTNAKNCSALGNLSIARPKICSFSDEQHLPIVCCPPNAPFNPSRIENACQEHNEQYCSKFRDNQTEDELYVEVAVVGGYEAKSRTHVHMALIGYGESNAVEWLCGGSIISNSFILTAAHCYENYARKPARWVRVGDLDLDSEYDDASPQTIGISQRIIHPEYKPPALYNDIALFRLERPIEFNEWVGPVCLSALDNISFETATVTGWGRTAFAKETSAHLLAVEVPLVETDECRNLLGQTKSIPYGIDFDSMICAGEREGGKDACSGDSGGPLVVNYTDNCLKTQIGVISFGRMCALPNSPGVYTRIYSYLPWIQSIVWP